MNIPALSVGELSDILTNCFNNPRFSSLQVYGEVYSIRLGKFSYIEIGDQGKNQSSSPLLKCAFSSFQRYQTSLSDIKVGDVIMVTGKLSYYAHGSSITLWGNEVSILQSQEGKTLLEKKKTLEKLDKLGYLTKEKKKIPQYCNRIAILTAETGAAYQDILKTLHDRFPVSTDLYPVIVQGEGAARSMVKALLEANTKDYDCILLGRGGGSKTDLSCYDDEKLCLAIAQSRIPVITCIGHTIDTAIADRVSDYQAITPTEGASLINPSLSDVKRRREDYISNLNQRMNEILQEKISELAYRYERLQLLSPLNHVKEEKEKIISARKQMKVLYSSSLDRKLLSLRQNEERMSHLMEILIQKKRMKINSFKSFLDKYDMKSMAEKGYAMVYRDGALIKSSTELSVNDEITITYYDGRVKATIKEGE